jgi:hypothetical protein
LQDPPKIYPNLDFWLENKPSGNPDLSNKRGKEDSLKTRRGSVTSHRPEEHEIIG